MKLRIGKPYLEHVMGKVRVCASISQEEHEPYIAWYEFETKYEEYICIERADAFVINVLLYAMEHGLDIECEQVLSEKLYYHINEYLIPCISKNIRKYQRILVDAPISNEKLECKNAVGASLSGGVDSFYTLAKHISRKEKSFEITHLTFFNAGASGSYGGEEARKKYLDRIDWIKEVADCVNKEFICVDTNFNEFLKQDHRSTHTFRTLSIPLVLQKLFAKYYFATGYALPHFEFCSIDTADYDLLNVACFETETISFYASGIEATRMDKLKEIVNFEITEQYLNVCVSEAVNCGKCEKCRRTMMGLYALGKLEKYKAVFDLDYFNDHRESYFDLVYAKRDEHDWAEIYALMNKNEFTIRNYLIGTSMRLFVKAKKIAKKIIYKE